MWLWWCACFKRAEVVSQRPPANSLTELDVSVRSRHSLAVWLERNTPSTSTLVTQPRDITESIISYDIWRELHTYLDLTALSHCCRYLFSSVRFHHTSTTYLLSSSGLPILCFLLVPLSTIAATMRSFLGLIALLPVLSSSSPVFNVDTIHNGVAPLLSSTSSKPVPDSYIVVFKDHVSHTSAAAHHGWVMDLHKSSESPRSQESKRSQVPFMDTVFEGLKHTYNIAGGLMGYSGHFDEKVIEEIRRHPDVSIDHGESASQFTVLT